MLFPESNFRAESCVSSPLGSTWQFVWPTFNTYIPSRVTYGFAMEPEPRGAIDDKGKARDDRSGAITGLMRCSKKPA